MPGPALRGALYYPYIHPRNVEWLKGTLLAFGQVSRLVPRGYPLRDPPQVAFLRDYPGPRNEPLLRSISPDFPHLHRATERLAAALRGVDPEDLQARYGRHEVQLSDRKPYEIHRGKLERHLLDVLSRYELAWPARRVSPSARGDRSEDWYAVHPELGSAIMSIIAIAAAREDGLDIVTDSMPLHQALASLDEQTVLSALFRGHESPEPPAPEAQMVDQLVHMIMTTTFDLSSLTVKDVAELVSDGHDLRAFKAAVTEAASSVPRDAGPDRREVLLRQVAEEVVEEWQRYRVTLPRKLMAALRDATSSSASAILKRAGSALKGLCS